MNYKIDFATLGTLSAEFTPSQTTGWNTAVSIDISSFPDGAKLKVEAKAMLQSGSSQSIGLRIDGDYAPSITTVASGAFASLSAERVITKSGGTTLVQTLGDWTSSVQRGGYIVTRVG